MEEYFRLREQQVQRDTESPNSTDSFHESHHVKSIFWGCVARGPGVGDRGGVAAVE